MRFAEMIALSVRNLLRHILRSLLTMLGIIFGIVAVISVLAVGAGAREELMREIGKRGVNNITLNSKKPPEKKENSGGGRMQVNRYGIKKRDVEQINLVCANKAGGSDLKDVLQVRMIRKNVFYKDLKSDPKVLGVGPEYFLAAPKLYELKTGRLISQNDEDEKQNVCVITDMFLAMLVYRDDPLKLNLYIGSRIFRVVGVLKTETFASLTRKARELDASMMEIYIPFETADSFFPPQQVSRRAGVIEAVEIELDQVIVQVADSDNVRAVARKVRTVMSQFHPDGDYEVIVPLELLIQKEKTRKIFRNFLLIIAGISLLVGGIGIVNVMLATVTERTREIGIRRALGAKRHHIISQFLVETITLSTLGGILGSAAGIFGAIYLIEPRAGFPVEITAQSVFVAVGISCLLGVVSGIYPAWRAAHMDPIEALRHE